MKQTRCTTCEAEHVYKGGREPRRRKKAEPGALYREVLAGMPDAEYGHAGTGVAEAPGPSPSSVPHVVTSGSDGDHDSPGGRVDDEEPVEHNDDSPEEAQIHAAPVEEGPVNRPLIRATLPRPEGQKEVRQVTDFTVRHSNGGRDNAPFRAERPPQRGTGGAGSSARQNGRRFSGGSVTGAPGRGGSPSRGGGGAAFRGANGPHRQGGPGGPVGPGRKKRSR
ncbi:MAG: hypothetical protein ABIP65_03965 [Vicinamibacterales bacterium]